MDSSNYSLADIGALVGKDNDGMFGGSAGGFIVLILFILLATGGFGGFGTAAGANQVTNDFLFSNLSSQVRDLGLLTNSGFQQATQQNFDIQKDICQSTNSINTNITNVGYQMQDCCCQIKTAIHAEGEATRALITENETQRLRTDLQSAQLTLANANQTQNILNAIGSYKPYGACGCGCSQFA